MPGKRNTPIPPPTDFTKNGQCSRCGGCCASLLPVTDAELTAMKAAADAIGFTPEIPGVNHTTVYLRCPFLDTEHDSCVIYDARPQICKSFLCSRSHQGNAKVYQDAVAPSGITDTPPVRNVWQLYNKTGIKLQGEDIRYNDAPYALLGGSDGSETRVQVGRPVSILTANNDVYQNVMIIEVRQEGLLVFDGIADDIAMVPYQVIRELDAPQESTEQEEQ